ncbi:ATP-binding protein [Actinomadura parmotrematis]|uniref:AAA+ ATPase domain-containing protein n=1 Tax=Actinomadura parmotrematis TaxID=2864039 RepID=A0ABS7FYP2_9ACTN|nr:tetratricopeptide repeat protein [Actinomadura parmotrematis]MBW8485552.1 hypothetical protein [Actinomadura parmotrematis]
MADEQRPEEGNAFTGEARQVVQAGSVHGGIHISGSRRPLPSPRQLPRGTTGFVDRQNSLRVLDGMLGDLAESKPDAATAAIVAGAPGVGKTALTLQWAHHVRRRFPDGDLYVDMHGYGPGRSLTPAQALDGFLRALDVPGEAIPDDLDERAGLYRSLLEGRRLLLIIDNASAPADVRPLLPASRGCFAMITSRSTLSGLMIREGAVRVTLDVLPPDESVELLARAIGADRVGAEREAAHRVAVLCGHLPLALRVVAEHAASRPGLSMAALAAELAGERHRLDALAESQDELSDVRAAFSWSYRALPDDLRRAFRLLGLHTGPDIGVPAAAALLDADPSTAARRLRGLTGAHLAQEDEDGRFRLHDLLRAYARELAQAEDDQSARTRAVRRLLGWYLLTVDAGRRALLPYSHAVPMVPGDGLALPGFADGAEAMRWFERERLNLLAALRQAVELGQYDIGWKLPVAADGFFELASYWVDWEEIHRLGLDAARALGDPLGEAANLLCLGDAAWRAGDADRAAADYARTVELARQLTYPWLEGFGLRGLGLLREEGGDPGGAAGLFREALAVFRQAGLRRGEGMARLSLGRCAAANGDQAEAVRACTAAVEIFAELDDAWSEAWGTLPLAAALTAQGRAPDAVHRLRRAADLFRRFGDRRSEAMALAALGDTLDATGDPAGAATAWRGAADLYELLGDEQAEALRARAAASTGGNP